MLHIRSFTQQDTDQIAKLFHETVRSVNLKDYSLAQVKAWAPDDIYFRDWQTICAARMTYIAEQSNIIIGFTELEKDGHIDMFYTHKNYQGCGVGRALYETIKAKAQQLNLDRLYTEASITAQPFFNRMGFKVLKKQTVWCRSQIFINYLMEITLANSLQKISIAKL